jgi:chromosome partitioning protein
VIMAKVISFINMKGGVGKTTLAVNIGYTIAKKFNKKVLLIDVDPQMNATQYTLNESQVSEILNFPRKSLYGLLEPPEQVLPKVLSTETQKNPEHFEGLYSINENFSIIPSHLRLIELKIRQEEPELLDVFIKTQLKGKYDVIIIDSPPTISDYTNLALHASDYYVVPMMAEPLAFFGLPRLELYVSDFNSEYGLETSLLGIILNKVHPTHNLYKNIKSKIQTEGTWKSKLFVNELKETTNISKVLSDENDQRSQYILDINDNEAAAQIFEITKEFMQKGRF